MRSVWVGLAVWGLMTNVFAAEVCVTIDRTGWTQDQKNLMHSVVYELSVAADPVGAKEPHDDQGQPLWKNNTASSIQVCLTDPGFDVPTVVTATTVLNQFASDQATREAVRVAEVARLQTLRDEIDGNTLCTATLDELTSRIDTAVDGVTNLPEMKVVSKTLFKRIARCVRARQEIPFR